MVSVIGIANIERFRGIIAIRLGLHFEDAKVDFLGEVLRRRLDLTRQQCEGYLDLLDAGASRAEIYALARELTVGETYFFRNIDQFRAFSQVVLPDRLQVQASQKRIRILSAGCASGEEAYSLGILLREAAIDPAWDVSILAVDINPATIEAAVQARFSPWALRETPLEVQQQWLSSSSPGTFSPDPSLRHNIRFEVRNLVEDDPELWRSETYDVIFCRNVGMAATVLHFVNSGYFGNGSPISSPERAVRMLGVDVLRELIVSNCTYSAKNVTSLTHFDTSVVWCEAIGTSVAARAISSAHSPDPALAEAAFAAGLFHDIGQVVLARALGSFYDSILARAALTGEPLWKVERETIGSTHADVGAYLLGLWGLPDAVVDAVAHHHSPDESGESKFSAVTAVHVADAIEHQKLNKLRQASSMLDHAYLRRLGLDQRWETWLEVLSN